jgi:hypothetical protein
VDHSRTWSPTGDAGGAIVERHHEILDILIRLPDHDSRRGAIHVAASSVNWRGGGAADRFIRRLAHSSPSSSRHQRPDRHSATFQR